MPVKGGSHSTWFLFVSAVVEANKRTRKAKKRRKEISNRLRIFTWHTTSTCFDRIHILTSPLNKARLCTCLIIIMTTGHCVECVCARPNDWIGMAASRSRYWLWWGDARSPKKCVVLCISRKLALFVILLSSRSRSPFTSIFPPKDIPKPIWTIRYDRSCSSARWNV